MTDPPDYVMRTATFGGPAIHQEPAKIYQPGMLSQDKQDQFNRWNQNIAGKDGLAAGNVPVAGSSVSGTVNTNNLSIAPATAVAVKTTNMLVSNNFTSPDTIVAQLHWSWDGTDGNLTLGCALVRCDGTQYDFISNEMDVITGETIEVACQVKWEGLVYTGVGPQIVLGIQKYRKGRDKVTGGVTYLDVGGYDVDTVESPATDSDWEDVQLAGTYVVQPGVDQIRFRLRAAQTITQGVVKWDECIFLKLDLIDDNAVPGVGTTVDDIVKELYGSAGEGFTHNESAIALANTAAALLSVNARLAALEAEGSTGVIAGDDFLWTGEITADANWGGSYTDPTLAYGSYRANGTDAVWSPGTYSQVCQFDWQGTGEVSGSDYQLVQLVLASAPVESVGYKSYIHLLGRVSSGFGSYVRARFGSDGTYAVDYISGGTVHGMASGTCPVPGMGSIVSLYCGDKATTTPRRFKLVVNGTPIADFTEIGTGSPLGGSNRKWGWGAEVQGGVYMVFFIFGAMTQAIPPIVNQWLAYDQ